MLLRPSCLVGVENEDVDCVVKKRRERPTLNTASGRVTASAKRFLILFWLEESAMQAWAQLREDT
jgi:hypothetical protein